MNQDCLFCRIAAGTLPADVIYQDEHAVAFRDLNPQAPTHVLVVPRRHIAGLADAPDGAPLFEELFAAVYAVVQQEDLVPGGFRTVINTGRDAQQSVAHLHIHVLGGRPFGWPPG